MNGSKQLWNIAKAKGKGLWGYLKKTIFNLSMCQNNSNTQTKLFCYCIIVDNNLKFHANQLWLPINISRYTYWKREENIVYNDEKCLATTKSPLKLIPNWLEWKMKKKKRRYLQKFRPKPFSADHFLSAYTLPLCENWRGSCFKDMPIKIRITKTVSINIR